MSHDFVLTEEDTPSGNTHAEDILELSLLSAKPNATVVDISWENAPRDF